PSAGHIPRCPEANAREAGAAAIHVSARTSSTTEPRNHLRMQVTINHAVVSWIREWKAFASSRSGVVTVMAHGCAGTLGVANKH
ncbi:MAG: hypothetical protein EBQ56_05885, partial [Proteobacteria bacterium]|nr:hypothetical protein [Pseudomonadota bacterium]